MAEDLPLTFYSSLLIGKNTGNSAKMVFHIICICRYIRVVPDSIDSILQRSSQSSILAIRLMRFCKHWLGPGPGPRPGPSKRDFGGRSHFRWGVLGGRAKPSFPGNQVGVWGEGEALLPGNSGGVWGVRSPSHNAMGSRGGRGIYHLISRPVFSFNLHTRHFGMHCSIACNALTIQQALRIALMSRRAV